MDLQKAISILRVNNAKMFKSEVSTAINVVLNALEECMKSDETKEYKLNKKIK